MSRILFFISRRNSFLFRLWRAPWEPLAILVALGSFIYIGTVSWDGVSGKVRGTQVSPAIFATYSNCHGQAKQFCVVDGDTIRFEGVKIRISDIDTPEVFSPKCRYEADLGRKATQRMQVLLNEGPVTLMRNGSRDVDRYGRKLLVVMRSEQSLGDILVTEGLARRWDGARRSWCG